VIRTVSEAAKGLAAFVVPGNRKQEGARYLRRRELRRLLRSRHTGLLIDGKSGRLSEAHSFQNVCVVARV
jgi:cation transport regulator ChaC